MIDNRAMLIAAGSVFLSVAAILVFFDHHQRTRAIGGELLPSVIPPLPDSRQPSQRQIERWRADVHEASQELESIRQQNGGMLPEPVSFGVLLLLTTEKRLDPLQNALSDWEVEYTETWQAARSKSWELTWWGLSLGVLGVGCCVYGIANRKTVRADVLPQ